MCAIATNPVASASDAAVVEHPVQTPTHASGATSNTCAQMDAPPPANVTIARDGGAFKSLAEIYDTHDAFDDLLTALNPYADELANQPTFHLFTKLPAELRCKIYYEYFLENNSSVACHGWPNLKLTPSYVNSIRYVRKSAPFLPNLCLTNRELRNEMLSCLLEATHFEFDNGKALGIVTKWLQTSSMEFVHKVRRATMKNINQMQKRFVIETDPWGSTTDGCELLQQMTKVHGSLIPLFPQLRELNLTCYAPLLYKSSRLSHGIVFLKANSIKNYLEGFPLDPIFGLEELQKFSVTGIGGSSNPYGMFNGHPTSIIDDGKAGNLSVVSDLCREIKKGFREQGRNVRVKACLQWAPEEYIEETFDERL